MDGLIKYITSASSEVQSTHSMEQELIDPIRFEPDLVALLKKGHGRAGASYVGQVEHLAAEAARLARPKAVFRLAFIEERGEDWVQAGGQVFHSRVLRVNLQPARRVFACLATCGSELGQWAAGFDDLLLRYWAEELCRAALDTAFSALTAHLDHRYQLTRTGFMSPGSLEDWPLVEQQPLFALLGRLAQDAGVSLTDSHLMLPVKSLSGLRFPTEETFVSCRLCPREDCSGRRAPYEPGLYEQRYKPGALSGAEHADRL